MWNREELEKQLEVAGVKGKCWGKCGAAAVDEIERALSVALPRDVRHFGEQVGNMIVGPFSVILCGSEDGKLTCVTETLAVRKNASSKVNEFIKIMDHAGESYFAEQGSEVIRCYDNLNIQKGMETQSFVTFRQFIDWLFTEGVK